ncbi:cation transporter [Tardiphaga alba]|uniref:Cation transporter n=1 Tax=Tardiphaga alba TaxID=340268 RepID=A0ABX8A2K9_9BRAD|nr:cation diffusion facilitator family transporter [Tardiphaga alba]QUS37756.1 cation transporter [Tardiphaga alba]
MAHAHHHDHAHDHHDHAGHSHDPGGHVHAPASFGKAFAIGITLNTVFVVVEAVYGYAAGSMALVADAGHNLSDVLGLIAAWTAAVLSKRAATPRYTYGLKASSILAALFNAVFLLVAVGAIAWEAVHRLFNPEPVTEITVIVVATIGIVINGITALMFASGRNSDLNIRGAYLHMVADAAVSVGVVIAAIVIIFTGWMWVDAVTSLLICVLIVWGTWSLLRDSAAMSLAAVPRGIDPAAVRSYLETCEGVAQVHDLHIWPMSTTEVALTCHLVIPTGAPGDAYLMDIAERLKHDFGIEHATIQIETDPNSACALAPEHVI